MLVFITQIYMWFLLIGSCVGVLRNYSVLNLCFEYKNSDVYELFGSFNSSPQSLIQDVVKNDFNGEN